MPSNPTVVKLADCACHLRLEKGKRISLLEAVRTVLGIHKAFDHFHEVMVECSRRSRVVRKSRVGRPTPKVQPPARKPVSSPTLFPASVLEKSRIKQSSVPYWRN